MTFFTALLIFAGSFAGGFVSGLAGFGNGLASLSIWLHVLAPIQAAPLVLACSVTSQAQTIPAIRHAIDLRHLLPMLLAGVVGVPFGVALLAHVDPDVFRLCVGLLLVSFSIVLLAGQRHLAISWGGRTADSAVGLVGGVLGGLAGLSGVLPTMWATLRGWSKDHRRGVFQAYNLTVLSVALLVQAVRGFLTLDVLLLFVVALPGTVIGSWVGFRTYRRLTDKNFHHVVLVLLGFLGVSLVWASLFR